jgi:hypothetical protein
MLQGLDYGEGPEEANRVRTEFDNSLGVSGWTTPGAFIDHQPEREPGTPLWWQGDEDASQSFLRSQGVILTK